MQQAEKHEDLDELADLPHEALGDIDTAPDTAEDETDTAEGGESEPDAEPQDEQDEQDDDKYNDEALERLDSKATVPAWVLTKKQKEWREKTAQEREQYVKAQEKLANVLERMERAQDNRGKADAGQQDAAENPHDPEMEPEAHRIWALERTVEQLKSGYQSTQQAQVYTQAAQVLERVERDFIERRPEYSDAKQHMLGVMTQYYKRNYPEATDMQIKAQVEREWLERADQYAARNVHPAEALLEDARLYGWAPTAKTSAPKHNGTPDLARVEANAQKYKTLSGAGSKPGAKQSVFDLDAKQIAKMSEDEIFAMLEKAGG